MLSGELRPEWLRCSNGPSGRCIAQLTNQKEACHGDMMGNPHSQQPGEKQIDRGLCKVRDYRGTKASSRHRDSDDARAGTYGQG
jgi:hypothetical protein